MNAKKTVAPARIYLQRRLYEDLSEPRMLFDQITWCADQIDDSDVEYVRADLHERTTKRLRDRMEMFQRMRG